MRCYAKWDSDLQLFTRFIFRLSRSLFIFSNRQCRVSITKIHVLKRAHNCYIRTSRNVRAFQRHWKENYLQETLFENLYILLLALNDRHIMLRPLHVRYVGCMQMHLSISIYISNKNSSRICSETFNTFVWQMQQGEHLTYATLYTIMIATHEEDV